MSVIIKLLSKFDDSGIKKAKGAFGGLKGVVAGIGVASAIAGIQQVGEVLLDAAKAAQADQKSMNLLNSQLQKNAKATPAQIKENNKFIDSLSMQVGIVDDDLRPAMGKLVRATGDTQKSQKLLKLALDASVASGKPLNTVADALSKAFVGNETSLIRLFPALKKSKDLFGDLEKQVQGTAEAQADPFSKLTVALDNLKEQLGYAVLPFIQDFIDKLIAPNGAVDAVNQFFEDVANPRTDAGKAFKNFGDIISKTIKQIEDGFAIFGQGDSLKGFENILNVLSQISGFLKTISDFLNPLVQAVNFIQSFGPQLGINLTPAPSARPSPVQSPRQGDVIINVQNADPKAVVDAVSRYAKNNGGVPGAWSLTPRR